MTREETVKIIRIMADSYPNYKPSNITETINVWQMMLSEYTYQQVAAALKAHVLSDTSGFAPSIGQLVDKIALIESPQELNEMEAWSLVSRALRNGYYGAEAEYEKLPPLVQKAVGQPSQLRQWAQTDQESVENVIQSNFIRTYRTVTKRAHDTSKLPMEIRSRLEQKEVPRIEYQTEKNEKPDYTDCVPMPETAKQKLTTIFRG